MNVTHAAASARTPVRASPADGIDFELHFANLFEHGRAYSFPCDAAGLVDLDRLTERARGNYLYARTMIGRDLHFAVVRPGVCAGPIPRLCAD